MKKYLIILAMVGVLTQRALGDEKLGNSTSGNIGNARFTLRENKLLLSPYVELGTSRYNYNLLNVQNSETTENNETSGWKQWGIYGLELLVSEVVSISWAYVSLAIGYSTPAEDLLVGVMKFSGDILLVGPTVWGVGELLGEKGSLWKAVVGAVTASLLGFATVNTPPGWAGMIFLPPLGAVIGYNF